MSQEIDNLLYIEQVSIDNCINTLKRRFIDKKIYTQLGSVLLSINPYQYFEGVDNIYDFNNTDRVHLFRTMDKVFKNLEDGNQVIIVSGESGSGKTETTKQIVHYLNHRSKSDSLLEKIEASGLLLEIFGNAPTQKNHNSSRFGKFIQVFYNERLECLGMKTSVYLLEKTRVLLHDNDSIGKFHIFTQPREKTLATLKRAGFTDDNIQLIFRVVDIIQELLDTDYSSIKNPLLNDILTFKITDYQGEKIRKEYSPDEFAEVRNMLIMKLYDFLFQWLVDTMNNFYKVEESVQIKSIGILDIFGFEDLARNSLEQLCINYANEIIQNLLNNMLIENKIALYKEEDIPLEEVEIKLNKEQIELIEQIFIKLDEECMLPRGSSAGFLQKLCQHYDNHPNFIINKLTKNREMTLRHYAGDICYIVEDFCKKNIDRAHNEIDGFIMRLFGISTRKKTTGKLKINSITNQFRNQLADFISIVSQSQLYFIKCIKPNSAEIPMTFENELVSTQLNYNGILQLIQILKQGYSLHYHIGPFLKEYQPYIHDQLVGIHFGRTRVFLTEECYDIIRRQWLSARLLSIQCLQTNVRRCLHFSHYQNIQNAHSILQNRIWANYNRMDYLYHRSAYRIQLFFRGIVNKNQFNRNIMSMRITRFFRKIQCNNRKLANIKNIHQLQGRILTNHYMLHYRRLLLAINIIKNWWRAYLRKKNDWRKQNEYLEKELKLRDKHILLLEKRIVELEQKLSRTNHIDKTILTERDHYIVSLKRDIDSYQNNIKERLEEKMRLVDIIEHLTIENKILVRQLGYIRRENSQNWLSRFFGM